MHAFYYPDCYCRTAYPPFYPGYVGNGGLGVSGGGGYGGAGGGFGCGMNPLWLILLYLTFRMVRNGGCDDKGRRRDDLRDEFNVSDMPLILFILLFMVIFGGEGRRSFF